MSQNFQRIQDSPACGGESFPQWWNEKREERWKAYCSLPFPSRKDEAWRFAALPKLDEKYVLAEEVSPAKAISMTACSVLPFPVAGRMVFVNGKLERFDQSAQGLLDKGLIFKPLSAMIQERPEWVKDNFMATPVALGSEKWEALHGAFTGEGCVLDIPEGMEVVEPFLVFHWLSGENASVFPHTVARARAGSRGLLFEVFISQSPHISGFACAQSEVVADEGASLTSLFCQNWSDSVQSFHMNSTLVKKDASVQTLAAHLGSSYSRYENRSRLTGSGARSEMLAVSMLQGEQEFDQRTLQDHLSPNTWSDLLYKNALNNTAHSIFQGLIRVEPRAYGTDAYQTNRNLLLSGDAKADSMPGLEILDDDVKCSHGATTGEVDDELLFYLQTRGLSREAAKHLLVHGFFGEVLDRVKEKGIADYLAALLESKFGRAKKKACNCE